MMIKENRPAVLGNPKKQKPSYGNSTQTQKARILEHFSNGRTLTTKEARECLGVLNLSARISELRKLGHRIEIFLRIPPDSNGVSDRTGAYIYLGMVVGVKNE